ncbi:DUF2007 domain-containing protein [Vibrio sp. 2-Bac 85]
MLITIAVFLFPLEAYINKSKLENEGIPVFLTNEHTINMQWLYSNALGGVGLQVPNEFLEIAKAILNEDRTIDLIEQQGNDIFQCPICGSEDTIVHQTGRLGAFFTFILVGSPLWRIKNRMKCNRCGFISN